MINEIFDFEKEIALKTILMKIIYDISVSLYFSYCLTKSMENS